VRALRAVAMAPASARWRRLGARQKVVGLGRRRYNQRDCRPSSASPC